MGTDHFLSAGIPEPKHHRGEALEIGAEKDELLRSAVAAPSQV